MSWRQKVLAVTKPGEVVKTPYGGVFVHPNKGRRYIKLTNGTIESYPKFLLKLKGVNVPKGVDVHHKNEDKLDDREDNYEYSEHCEHARNHLNFKKAEFDYSQYGFNTEDEFIRSLSENLGISYKYILMVRNTLGPLYTPDRLVEEIEQYADSDFKVSAISEVIGVDYTKFANLDEYVNHPSLKGRVFFGKRIKG